MADDTATANPNLDTVTLTDVAMFDGQRAGNPGDRVARELADKHGWEYRENDEPDPTTTPPAGNASLEAWQEFALAQPGVTPESIDGLGRDELRDRFGG